MLALRDKENLVHAHQTTAAAKPLNGGLRQLQPKTPGTRAPKTPYKLPLNDENNVTALGKKTVKGNGGGAGIAQQSSKDAFVTPMGPRNRAPLGMKTTNAKATGFQTPGLQPDNLKTQKTNRKGSSLKKAKKIEPLIQQSEHQVLTKPEEEDVPDVEYAPPKPKELPDDPEDIPYDTTFPQFKGRNMVRGWERVYLHGEVGEDGLTDRQRKFKQSSISYDKMVDEMIQKQVDDLDCWDEFDPQPRKDESVKGDEKKVPAKSVSTLKARNAAAALSHTRSTSINRVASSKPPVTTKPRTPSSMLMPKRRTPTPTNPSIAAASSRTTVGYSKGRSVSSSLQTKTNAAKAKQAPKSILDPAKYMELYGPPPVGSEMWMQCKDAGLVVDPEEVADENNAADVVLSLLVEDEESRDFQLTL